MRLYKIICYSTAILFSFLMIQLMAIPEKFAADLGLIPGTGVSVVLRRAAIFMAGIVVLTIGIRNLPPSRSRQSVCISLAVTFLGLSTMGSIEFFRGTVNSSILLSIFIELSLAMAYLIVFIRSRKFVNL
ncbi:MAG: hypothetical protein JXA77_09450 [Bacteroidales bacterium]|nr:hypothetical protein [Bacteroidales bacterium]MBN2817394.1 hypothetical protein [Bacteroidales bacterium]